MDIPFGHDNVLMPRYFRPVSVHLVKLCVGCDSVKELREWVRERLRDKRAAGQAPEHVHTTRMTPKREAELAAGSLYWVIRGEVLCRQRLRGLRPIVDASGVNRCQIVLDPKIIEVDPRPMRAFQGWRYLSPSDAPPDLRRLPRGEGSVPEPIRRELRSLGLW